MSTYSVILTGPADHSMQKHQLCLVQSGESEVASVAAFLEQKAQVAKIKKL